MNRRKQPKPPPPKDIPSIRSSLPLSAALASATSPESVLKLLSSPSSWVDDDNDLDLSSVPSFHSPIDKLLSDIKSLMGSSEHTDKPKKNVWKRTAPPLAKKLEAVPEKKPELVPEKKAQVNKVADKAVQEKKQEAAPQKPTATNSANKAAGASDKSIPTSSSSHTNKPENKSENVPAMHTNKLENKHENKHEPIPEPKQPTPATFEKQLSNLLPKPISPPIAKPISPNPIGSTHNPVIAKPISPNPASVSSGMSSSAANQISHPANQINAPATHLVNPTDQLTQKQISIPPAHLSNQSQIANPIYNQPSFPAFGFHSHPIWQPPQASFFYHQPPSTLPNMAEMYAPILSAVHPNNLPNSQQQMHNSHHMNQQQQMHPSFFVPSSVFNSHYPISSQPPPSSFHSSSLQSIPFRQQSPNHQSMQQQQFQQQSVQQQQFQQQQFQHPQFHPLYHAHSIMIPATSSSLANPASHHAPVSIGSDPIKHSVPVSIGSVPISSTNSGVPFSLPIMFPMPQSVSRSNSPTAPVDQQIPAPVSQQISQQGSRDTLVSSLSRINLESPSITQNSILASLNAGNVQQQLKPSLLSMAPAASSISTLCTQQSKESVTGHPSKDARVSKESSSSSLVPSNETASKTVKEEPKPQNKDTKQSVHNPQSASTTSVTLNSTPSNTNTHQHPYQSRQYNQTRNHIQRWNNGDQDMDKSQRRHRDIWTPSSGNKTSSNAPAVDASATSSNTKLDTKSATKPAITTTTSVRPVLTSAASSSTSLVYDPSQQPSLQAVTKPTQKSATQRHPTKSPNHTKFVAKQLETNPDMTKSASASSSSSSARKTSLFPPPKVSIEASTSAPVTQHRDAKSVKPASPATAPEPLAQPSMPTVAKPTVNGVSDTQKPMASGDTSGAGLSDIVTQEIRIIGKHTIKINVLRKQTDVTVDAKAAIDAKIAVDVNGRAGSDGNSELAKHQPQPQQKQRRQSRYSHGSFYKHGTNTTVPSSAPASSTAQTKIEPPAQPVAAEKPVSDAPSDVQTSSQQAPAYRGGRGRPSRYSYTPNYRSNTGNRSRSYQSSANPSQSVPTSNTDIAATSR